MALQRQNIPVPFAQGADTKTDSYLLPPGKLTTLQNGYLTKNGTVRKRPGHISLGSTIAGGGTMGAGQGIAAYTNELVVMDPAALYSYSPGLSGFQKKGSFVSCSVTQDQVIRGTSTYTQQDCATNTTTGLQLVVGFDGTVNRYSIVDTATGQVLVDRQILDANAGAGAKTLPCGSYLVAIYIDSTNHKVKFIAFAGTTALAAVDVSIASLNTLSFFDACVLPGVGGGAPSLAIVWNANDVGGAVRGSLYNAQTLVALVGNSVLSTGNSAGNGICVFGDSSLNTGSGVTTQRLICVYATATTIRCFSTTGGMTSGGGIADQLVDTPTLGGGTINGATGVSFNSNNTPTARLYWCINQTDHSTDWVRYASISGNTITLKNDYVRGHSLASKPFVQNGTAYITLAYDPNKTNYTGQQPSYFVVTEGNSQLRTAARLVYGNGGGRNFPVLPEVQQISSGIWNLAILQRDLLTTVPASPNLNSPPASGSLPSYVYTATGVTVATLNFFDQQRSYFNSTLADTLHVSGGCLYEYDSAQVVEHGFNVYPEGITVSMAGSGGAMTAGSYVFYATYEWTDAQGRLHRSAPSPGVQVTAVTNDKATVTVPTLRITDKANVQIVVYRTIANNLVPYRLGTPASPLLNVPTSDSVQLVDGTADTAITSAPPIYTLGNVVENIPLGPCTSLAIYKNRLFGIMSDDPLSVAYSKQVLPGAPLEFNSDELYVRVDPIGGPLVAIGVLDDKLVLFKENRILFSAGDGPDATGAGGFFSDPAIITTDCGCTDPRSVVTTPNGLMFRGHKGIYLIDRGLRVTYVGAPVENVLGANTVVSGTLSPFTQQVKFGLSDNKTVLVYDYLNDQWSWYVNPELASSAATVFQNLYTFVQPSGVVGQESLTAFTDFGNFIPLVVETGWFNLASLNGFVRLYAIEVLARYQSSHLLRLSLAFDNAEAYVQSADLASTSLFDPSTFGGGTGTWGSSPPTYWGGPGTSMVARFDPSTQKCRAFKIRIEDFAIDANYGESLSLTGMTLSIGGKAGLGKLPATQQVGVK